MKTIIKNVSLFKSVIRVFSGTEFVTFKITDQKIYLGSVSLNIYYVEIDTKIFEFENIEEFEEKEFTVSSLHLIKALKIFKNQLVLIIKNEMLEFHSRSMRTQYCTKIPLTITSQVHLNPIPAVDVIFTVKPQDIHLLRNFKHTHYFISENVLISQNVPGGKEEGILEVDFVESSIIDFKCDNIWFTEIEHLKKYVEEYVFVFSESILQISINLESSYGATLILQVPKIE